MALFTVIENEEDMARKIRVRVDLVDESLFFKYQTMPTEDEVDRDVIAFLTARENQDASTH